MFSSILDFSCTSLRKKTFDTSTLWSRRWSFLLKSRAYRGIFWKVPQKSLKIWTILSALRPPSWVSTSLAISCSARLSSAWPPPLSASLCLWCKQRCVFDHQPVENSAVVSLLQTLRKPVCRCTSNVPCGYRNAVRLCLQVKSVERAAAAFVQWPRAQSGLTAAQAAWRTVRSAYP